ncbi:hypothetical protein BDY24DRAFT_402778 [Mrakia frigida]|uniref:uncharacterized protein n=1 Tax=Mrakia frigida TaxID=29902 RepID=UPI003FCC0618
MTSIGSFVQGMIDRCSGSPGYVMAGDGSCIYTAGAPLTDTIYSTACLTLAPGVGTPNPAVSPAPFRKRKVYEQTPFVGGKICPIGEQACLLSKDLKCIDVVSNLNSCGGCIGGAGVDCSDLRGVDEVACVGGKCVAHSCVRGWSLSLAGQCSKT